MCCGSPLRVPGAPGKRLAYDARQIKRNGGKRNAVRLRKPKAPLSTFHTIDSGAAHYEREVFNGLEKQFSVCFCA